VKTTEQESRYKLRKRIERLQDDVLELVPYRNLALEIYDGCLTVIESNKEISLAWVLRLFRRHGVFK